MERMTSRSRSFPRARASATKAPVMDAVRVPPSAWMTSQSIQIVRSPSADRKSTRLNSSHVRISYAVFCLKKKKKNRVDHDLPIHILNEPLVSLAIRPRPSHHHKSPDLYHHAPLPHKIQPFDHESTCHRT